MRYAFLSLTALFLLSLAGCISPRRDSTSTNNGGSSDFTLAVSPSTTSVTAGATATFTVNVTANNGFTGTVTLSAAVPSTMQGTLSTTTISGGSGTATLSVTTSATAATGSSTVSVTGVEQGNGASQAANATITVTSATGASAQTLVQCITGEAGQPQSVLAAASPMTESFTANFDATPSVAMNGSVMLSGTTQTAHTPFAALINFAPSGVIQVQDSGIFTAASNIPYVPGKTYHFRMEINAPADSYSVFVTPAGGTELTLGSHLSFPTGQSIVQEAEWGVLASSSQGKLSACNFVVQ